MISSGFGSLRPASFRGVSFETDDHDKRGGRRLVKHEYPLRDEPYAEDLGRKARSWRVNAFYVHRRAVDVPKSRDELLEALEAAGPGTLLHPWLGEREVCVDDFSLHESNAEGGYCKFSIDFVEAGHNAEPKAETDTAAATAAAGQTVETAAVDMVMGAVAAIEETFAAVQNAFALVQEVIALPQTIVGNALAFVANGTATPTALVSAVFGLARMGFGLDAGSAFAALFPAHAAPNSAGGNLVGALPGTFATVVQSLASPGPSGSTTGIADSVVTANRLTATALVTAAAENFARTDFRAADDALAARDILVDALEAASEVAPDALYPPLCDLHAAVVVDASARAAKLPRIRRVSLPGTMPALAAAYRVHGDAGRDAEIITRNKIRHPGFVPGGTALEVLTR
jgi:prophage DNA circulation protein